MEISAISREGLPVGTKHFRSLCNEVLLQSRLQSVLAVIPHLFSVHLRLLHMPAKITTN